ncbi:hypothetical protein DFH09DRAFT_1411134 [Mycena vulgaris]|nr:hypothetical protein DFH09DRAFT_1411134 [Mycena vulgaris]
MIEKITQTGPEADFEGRCRGSPHIVQLLGKTAHNQLVFPKYKAGVSRFALFYSRSFTIAFVKMMLLSLIEGVPYLQSQNIIHHDHTARNLLMAGDLSSADSVPAVVIVDLKCCGASYSAVPELTIENGG